MTALGALALLDAEDAARLADVAGALSLEALKGTPRAFDPRIHAVRPHPGPGGERAQPRAPARRQRHRRVAQGLRQGAGPLLAALHAAGARRHARRARLRARACSRARRRRPPTTRSSSPTTERDDLGRQLPRPAGGAGARLRRHRRRRAGQHRRAAHRAAGQPAPVVGAAAVPVAATAGSTPAS